jgi:hypothetical protein
MQKNPYAEPLGDRDPVTAMGQTPQQIRMLVEGWSIEQFERSYAPGKWSARKILIHLAQTELALPTRVRYALGAPGYEAQSFEQDDWMNADNSADAKTALDAYTATRAFNLAMWRSLSAEQWQRTFTHPDFGELNVQWVAAQMAGHDLHHLRQFQQIAHG